MIYGINWSEAQVGSRVSSTTPIASLKELNIPQKQPENCNIGQIHLFIKANNFCDTRSADVWSNLPATIVFLARMYKAEARIERTAQGPKFLQD